MAKIKLTKGELKRQRDSLKQYQHYLPTLQLKKQQLQKKILEVRKVLDARKADLKNKEAAISRWVGLLADPWLGLGQKEDIIKIAITPSDISIETVNVAGANIPVLREINFPKSKHDLYITPLWVDKGIAELRSLIYFFIEIAVIQKQVDLLQKELQITTQRVNLFEKVKIPECMDNIRVIRIYLGDQQANAVGVSKVAKKKIEMSNTSQEALV